MSAQRGPVNRGREHVAVARNPKMMAFFGQPTTREIAEAEAAAKRLHWPEARVAVYRLVLATGDPGLGRDETGGTFSGEAGE